LSRGVGRMEKREIDELEPYLEKRNGFTWLPQSDTEYYASEAAHANEKISQNKRDLMNIPDYLLWSIGNFFLFFVFGIICIILSVRVREHKRTKDYDTTLKMSKRTLIMNIFTTIIGITFLVTMLTLLINKSSTNF
jgi:heme/copper-type cytochrome/quinol oxidase subunit 2